MRRGEGRGGEREGERGGEGRGEVCVHLTMSGRRDRCNVQKIEVS